MAEQGHEPEFSEQQALLYAMQATYGEDGATHVLEAYLETEFQEDEIEFFARAVSTLQAALLHRRAMSATPPSAYREYLEANGG